MNFNKNLIICALLAVMLLCCVSAVSASEDLSNMTLADENDDVISNEVSDDVISNEVSDDVLDEQDNTIYVDPSYIGMVEKGTQDQPYTTISGAVKGVHSDKSTIYIKNGTYSITSNIQLPADYGVTFVGESTDGVTINSGSGNSYFYMFSGNLNGNNIVFKDLTFVNTGRSQALNIAGEGNLDIIDCSFDKFSSYSGSSSAFVISTTTSAIKNSEITNLNSWNNNGPAYMTYGSGNHVIDDVVMDKFTGSYSLKGGVISVASQAAIDATSLTISNINAAINNGLIHVSGNANIRNSNFKKNALKTGSSVSVVNSLFHVDNGNLTVLDSTISDNSGFNYLVYQDGENASVVMNYNSIMNSVYKIDALRNTSAYDLNDNWWGVNVKPNDFVDSWVFMDLTINKNNLDVDITADFNKCTDGNNTYDLGRTMVFPVHFKSSESTLDTELLTQDNVVSTSFKINGDFYLEVNAGTKLIFPIGVYYVDSSFDGEEFGTQDNPFKTISKAVSMATGFEEIFIKNGTYYEKDGITLTNSLNIIGESSEGVVIVGGNKGVFNNPLFMTKEISLLFTNLTFKDTASNGIYAAITASKAVNSLNITNCIFDNCSGRWGSVSTESSNLIMDNCKILNSKSTAEGEGTGAIYINGEGSYEIKNTIIDNAQCIGTYMNAIVGCANNNALLTLDNVQITNTSAKSEAIVSGGKLNIKNSKFQNNKLMDDSAVINVLAESSIANSIISGNDVDTIVDVADSTVLTLSNNQITDNEGFEVIALGEGADVKLYSLTLSNNDVTYIINAGYNSTLYIDNTKILNNKANYAINLGDSANVYVVSGSIEGNNFETIFNLLNNSKFVMEFSQILKNNVEHIFEVGENSTVEVQSTIISDNNCTKEIISNNGENSSITLNYNIIMNNGETAFINQVSNHNFDYNWWNTNDKPNEFTDNWVIMDTTHSKAAGKITVNVNFNKYTDGTDVKALTTNLPNAISVLIQSSTLDFETENVINRGTTSATVTIGDNEYINITSDKVNIILNIAPKTYYVDNTFSGDENGSSDAPFKAIQTAINVAEEGDFVIIKGNTYSEKITWSGNKGLKIIGDGEVTISLASGSSISVNAFEMYLANLKFMGSGTNVYFKVENGHLEIVNCTFDKFTTSKEIITVSNSDSNIINSVFSNMEQSNTVRDGTLIISYSGNGNHTIKDVVIDKAKHSARSRLYKSLTNIYINSATANVLIDNLTMSNTDTVGESIVYNRGNLVIKNSLFTNNAVKKSGTSWGTCLFYNNNAQLTIETSVIKDNSGCNYLDYNTGAKSASNVNYNIIEGNRFNNGIATGSHLDFDYNWWNSATPTYAAANTWLIFDLCTEPAEYVDFEDVDLVATFNHYMTKDGKIGQADKNLFSDVEFKITFENGTEITLTGATGEVKIPYSVNGSDKITAKALGLEKELTIVPKAVKIILPENISLGDNVDVTVQVPGDVNEVTLIIDGVEESVKTSNGVATKTINNIQAGTHTVVAVFDGAGEYGFGHDSKTITVGKFATEINLEDATIDAGEAVPINIDLGSATGKVFFELNGEKFFEELKNGKISFDLEDLAHGTYALKVSYEGDEKYDSCDKTVTITVNGFDANLTANVSDIKVGEDAVINITINKNVTGETIVSFNGQNIPVIFNDGLATVRLSNLTQNTYNAVVKFAGDDKYLPTQTSVKFTVSKDELPENITVSTNIPEGTTAPEFSINLPSDATGNFTVYVDGQNYTQELVNGSATVKVPEQTPGNHTISTEYSGCDKYDGFSSENTTMNIPKASIPGGEDALNMTTPSDSSKPSYSINLPSDAKGNLTVTVDGKDTYTKALENGSATVDVPELSAGKHDITVTYTGDDKYSSISKNTTVTVHAPVVQRTVKLSGNKNINMLYSAGTAYKVRVTVNGKAVAGESVVVKFNGKTKTVKTDKNGYITFKIPNVKAKTYPITASYKGVTVKNTVKVKSIIKAKNMKVKKSKKVTKVKITLKKVNKKYLKGKKINIKFKGKKYTVKTNKKGVATWKVKKSMVKKLKVGKKFKYTVTYGKDTVNKILTIKK